MQPRLVCPICRHPIGPREPFRAVVRECFIVEGRWVDLVRTAVHEKCDQRKETGHEKSNQG
jgi:hypothetical protein